jgi:hypothetical protein
LIQAEGDVIVCYTPIRAVFILGYVFQPCMTETHQAITTRTV